MKRFELFEYDKETERLCEEETINEIGNPIKFVQKAFSKISNFVTRLKFGQRTKISLTPYTMKESLTPAGGMNPVGTGGAQLYGFHAEMVGVWKLADLMSRKGYNIPKSDITAAKNAVENSVEGMADSLKRGTLDARNHNARLAAAVKQGHALAERTFQDLIIRPDSIFAKYHLEFKTIKQKAKRKAIRIRGSGGEAITTKNTADLIIEKDSPRKMRDSLKVSLKAYQRLNERDKLPGHKGFDLTKGTETDAIGFLSRLYFWEDKKKAGRMAGMLRSGEFMKFAVDLGIDVDRIKKFIEMPKGDKKGQISVEIWEDVFDKVLSNPKFADGFKRTVFEVLDLSPDSSSLITSHWHAMTGEISTFHKDKMSPELKQFMDLSQKTPKDFDISIKRAGKKGVNIVISYEGVEAFEFNQKITGSPKGSGGVQFDAKAWGKQIYKENVPVNLSTYYDPETGKKIEGEDLRPAQDRDRGILDVPTTKEISAREKKFRPRPITKKNPPADKHELFLRAKNMNPEEMAKAMEAGDHKKMGFEDLKTKYKLKTEKLMPLGKWLNT